MKRRLLFFACSVSVLAGCDGTASEPEYTDLLVVEAFLYAGESIDDIRLSETMALSDTIEAPSVNDASVVLVKNGLFYTLTATGVDGYYEYTGVDLVVETGDTFGIEVTYLGAVATGETVVPAPPANVSIDGNTLWVPAFSIGMGRPTGFDPEESQLAVSWDNPEKLLHYVVIGSSEDSAETIFPEQFQKTPAGFGVLPSPRPTTTISST